MQSTLFSQMEAALILKPPQIKAALSGENIEITKKKKESSKHFRMLQTSFSQFKKYSRIYTIENINN